MRGGAAFELGACTGGALDQIRQRGFDVYGVEPDPKQAAFAREVLGLDVKNAVLDASTELPAPIDLAFSNHVFEHIDDLQSAMAGLTRVMRRGGYVFTCVPTYARNRSDLSIRWMNAGHLSMFTHRSLNQLFARFGFVEVTHTYRGWWKEVDDLWHLARYEGSAPAPETFYEDARSVQRYIGVVNRLRSAAYWPVFHDWERKYALAARVKKAALGWARR